MSCGMRFGPWYQVVLDPLKRPGPHVNASFISGLPLVDSTPGHLLVDDINFQRVLISARF